MTWYYKHAKGPSTLVGHQLGGTSLDLQTRKRAFYSCGASSDFAGTSAYSAVAVLSADVPSKSNDAPREELYFGGASSNFGGTSADSVVEDPFVCPLHCNWHTSVCMLLVLEKYFVVCQIICFSQPMVMTCALTAAASSSTSAQQRLLLLTWFQHQPNPTWPSLQKQPPSSWQLEPLCLWPVLQQQSPLEFWTG